MSVGPERAHSLSQTRCVRFRRRILEVSQHTFALHVGSAFSCVEILDAIYFSLVRSGPTVSDPDTVILSKGHASIAQYVILEALGVLTRADLDSYCRAGGRLGTHPDYGTPGIEASTGSLGHGLAIGVGMAIADRLIGTDRCIYIVMSDGELLEGSVWESVLLAPSLGLTQLVAFIDLNDYQCLGRTSETLPNLHPVLAKAEAFGWEGIVVDGHDTDALCNAVRSRRGDRPLMVIARTVKGKGVSYMEADPLTWHYSSVSPAQYTRAIEDLEKTPRE